MRNIIKLSPHELQSHVSRVKHAEGLIEQLPKTHEGRNTWLLNFGVKKEARQFRKKAIKEVQFQFKNNPDGREIYWSDEFECLIYKITEKDQ